MSSKEDDSRSEKERERDTRRCAWPPGGRGFGVPGQLFECRFWFSGTGVRFWHF